MVSKHIRPTNHNRNVSNYTSSSSPEESTPELDSEDETDQEGLEPIQDENDFAIYTEDEDSPNFTGNNDEDIGLTVSEGEEDLTPQPNYTPSVINYMPDFEPDEDETSSDFDGNDDDATAGDNDSDTDSMEQEEEDMIQDEFKDQQLGEDYDNDDSKDSSDSSEEEFYDLFDHNAAQYSQQSPGNNDEDDSYLWEYFFSSEDEGDTQANNAQENNQMEFESGESTDEEANLPPPSKRASSHRAVEVLGTNSHMRPPVLGSWNIDNANGNVGIIDGLTTRTLSPPPGEDEHNAGNQSWLSDSEEETQPPVQLDEFINTDELDFGDDDGDEENYLTTPLTYRSRFNKNVPLSAFRNRSSPYHTHYPYDHSFRRRRRSFGQPNNAIISPVRSLRKRPKQRPRKNVPYKSEDLGDDFLEFYELGNVTPLFEI